MVESQGVCFALFLKIVLAILGLLWFSINLSVIFFPSSMENAIGILIGIALNLYITLSSMAILTILFLLIQEHGLSLHFLISVSYINAL